MEMAKLTEAQCRDRAGAFLEAAEHLNVAWTCDDAAPKPVEVDFVYKFLMRQVDYWEVKAECFASIKPAKR